MASIGRSCPPGWAVWKRVIDDGRKMEKFPQDRPLSPGAGGCTIRTMTDVRPRRFAMLTCSPIPGQGLRPLTEDLTPEATR